MKITDRRIESFNLQLIGLIALVGSVSLLPTPQDEADGLTHRIRRQTRPVGNRTSSSRSSTFYFPGETQPIVEFVPRFGGSEKPPCANGSTFCDKVDDYPSQYIEKLLKEAGKNVKDVLTDDGDSLIATKLDDDESESLCTAVQSVIYPKMAQNTKDEWLYVVNQGEYKQGIRVEKCQSGGANGAGGQCRFHQMFPQGYTTTCKQKHVYRKLIALDKSGKTITDTFQLPSCCACVFKFDRAKRSV